MDQHETPDTRCIAGRSARQKLNLLSSTNILRWYHGRTRTDCSSPKTSINVQGVSVSSQQPLCAPTRRGEKLPHQSYSEQGVHKFHHQTTERRVRRDSVWQVLCVCVVAAAQQGKCSVSMLFFPGFILHVNHTAVRSFKYDQIQQNGLDSLWVEWLDLPKGSLHLIIYFVFHCGNNSA